MSGLVLLLPHGYEGQGPEHSSARIERYLQLCAERNMQVCNPTTPANYFHALRRQVHRNFRKPLVIFDAEVAAAPQAGGVAAGRFEPRARASSYVIPEIDAIAPPEQVRRVVLCSGKVYYDLLAERRAHRRTTSRSSAWSSSIRSRRTRWAAMLAPYTNADVVWCQEEPENMGAWNFVDRRHARRCWAGWTCRAMRPSYRRREAAAEPGDRPGARAMARAGRRLVAAALGIG